MSQGTTYAQGPARASIVPAWLRALDAPTVLLLGYLAFVFIGTHPLSEASVGERVEGSSVDRIVVLGLFALSLHVTWTHKREVWRRIGENIGVLAVVGFAMASIAWSDYPELTLRRSLLFFFLTYAALAIGATAPSLRRLHTILFVFLTGVMLLNLASIVIRPSVAISDIGVRGIYTQKNVAGYVAMLAAVCGGAWIIGAQSRKDRNRALLALAPTLLFLAVTRSKTSINLTVLAFAIGATLILVQRLGPRLALLAMSASIVLATVFGGLFAASGFNLSAALNATTGDATLTGRDELWAFARGRIAERPWLGYGYGAFWDVGPINDPLAKLEPGTWLADVEVGTINQAHNGYLELCLHLGVPATAFATLTILFGAVAALSAAMKRGHSLPDRSAFAAIAAILLIYLFHNLTEATLYMRGSAFWSLVSLALFAMPRPHILGAAEPYPEPQK